MPLFFSFFVQHLYDVYYILNGILYTHTHSLSLSLSLHVYIDR
jgi:hypothetical protein